MPHKLVIISSGNEQLYQSLRSTLSNEPDVAIISTVGAMRPRPDGGVERRQPSDVEERIRRDGFAVVRPAPPAQQPGNIRWTA